MSRDIIKLDQIDVTFHQKKRTITAVKDVTIHIQEGDIYGIVGYSGAGKSTLVRVINLLQKPSAGRITVDDDVIFDGKETLTAGQLRRKRQDIGMIFQHFNLMSQKTAEENVAFALKHSGLSEKDKKAKVAELLDLVGLADRAENYPSQLSGGQKQRVAIARALASDPKVLLCDEATSALDPATTQSILKLLKEINRTLGITILLITHEMEVVKRICDQVAVIDKGRLIEQGTVSEIFSNPKTELAQEFIRSTFHITLPEEYLENLSDTPKHAKSYPIIKFEFTGRSVDAPLLSQASKKFGVELSILTSQIDYAGGVKFGFTIAEVEGDEDAITQAKVYLMENNVRVEVLGYVQ